MGGGDHNGWSDAPIGALLERTRRARGLSLSDVEDATKIRTRYLDGLEREDFSVLPDAVYVRGFLRTYADFLGLDGEGLVREFKNRGLSYHERQPDYGRSRGRSELEMPAAGSGGLTGAETRRVSATTILRTAALAVLVLVAIIFLLYVIGSRAADVPVTQTPETPEASPPPQAPEPRPEEARDPAREEPREPATPPEETTAAMVRVTVSVPDYPAGLTVRADGEVAADVVAQPGFTQTFEARDAVEVGTNNAGAVTVEVDGENLGYLGYYGQPLTRTFGRGPSE